MWHGVGWIAGLLCIALIAWQAVRLSNISVEVGVTPAMITAFLAVLLLLFTVIKFFADGEARHWPAWIGLILAVVICAGAWWNMQLAGEGLGDIGEKLARWAAATRPRRRGRASGALVALKHRLRPRRRRATTRHRRRRLARRGPSRRGRVLALPCAHSWNKRN
jgi:hypothetical protein